MIYLLAFGFYGFLTVAAGVMREPFARFLLVVTVAKLGRYIVLAAVVLHWV